MMTPKPSLIDRPIECDGSGACAAVKHIHGCFADKGNCDDPLEHAAGRPVYDRATGEYLGQA